MLILAVVLFVGLATIGQLSTLNKEDLHSVMGMNPAAPRARPAWPPDAQSIGARQARYLPMPALMGA